MMTVRILQICIILGLSLFGFQNCARLKSAETTTLSAPSTIRYQALGGGTSTKCIPKAIPDIARRAIDSFRKWESQHPVGYTLEGNRNGVLANSEPEFLLGYLRAFETTNETYFLDRFLIQAERVLGFRDNVNGYLNFRGESAPVWSNCRVGYTTGGQCYPFTLESGLLSYPLLYFSMLVRQNSCLRGNAVNGDTYERTANRYLAAGKAAIDYHRRDWYEASFSGYTSGFFRAHTDAPFLVGQPAGSIDPVNYVTAMGRSYVLLGYLTGEDFYIQSARKVMRFAIEELYDGPNGSKIFNYWPRATYYPLEYKVIDSSVEDLSHLAITMEFFRVADVTGVWGVDAWMKEALRRSVVQSILPSPRMFMNGTGVTASVSYKNVIGQYSYAVGCDPSAIGKLTSLLFDELSMESTPPASVSGFLALPQFAHHVAKCF